MANQQINLNVHGKTGSPTAYTARSGVINRLHVEPRSNIELVDPATGKAPPKVVVKRSGQDLIVKAAQADGQAVEITLEGYYGSESRLIGLNELGNYVEYVPAGADQAALAQLGDGAVSLQGLGAEVLATPLWVAPVAIDPWLLGGLAIAGGAAAADIRAQITNRRNKFFQDAQTEMTKAREELNTYQEQLRDRSQVLEHTELLAPSDGIVNNIRATTLGAVLRPGDVVLELLPTGGDLIAETKISPTDIAFVTVGQTAFVKVDAFDSTVFGGLRGDVIYISPDVLKEETKNGPVSYYRVHILVRESEFKGKKNHDIELRPGLTAQVDIKARERTVLNYLTKPIVKTLSESLGER